MSAEDVAAQVARLTYKPGYTLSVEDSLGRPVLRLDAMLEDSRNPGRQVKIGMAAEVPPYLLRTVDRAMMEARQAWEAAVVRWVLDQVKRLELHEMLEWFRLDGELVSDPHAADRLR